MTKEEFNILHTGDYCSLVGMTIRVSAREYRGNNILWVLFEQSSFSISENSALLCMLTCISQKWKSAYYKWQSGLNAEQSIPESIFKAGWDAAKSEL